MSSRAVGGGLLAELRQQKKPVRMQKASQPNDIPKRGADLKHAHASALPDPISVPGKTRVGEAQRSEEAGTHAMRYGHQIANLFLE